MAERTTVSQKFQIGLETTPGTAVAANKILPTFELGYKPKAEIETFRPPGYKFPSVALLNREWSEGSLSGKPCYNGLTYWLAAILEKPTPTQPDPTNAPSVYQWTFTPQLSAEDTVATYTIERGSSVRADRITYAILTALSLSFSRSSADVSGTILGQQFEDGITLTASPTEVTEAPIMPGHIDVYFDSSAANIGTTKLGRLLSVEFAVGDRFGPLWVLDSSQASWATKVEQAPTVTMKLKMEADAVGMSPLTNMRAGSFGYLRLKATGPNIEATFNYEFTVDMAGKVSEEPSDLADQDGVYAIEWTFQAFWDDAWGKALTATLQNTLSAL